MAGIRCRCPWGSRCRRGVGSPAPTDRRVVVVGDVAGGSTAARDRDVRACVASSIAAERRRVPSDCRLGHGVGAYGQGHIDRAVSVERGCRAIHREREVRNPTLGATVVILHCLGDGERPRPLCARKDKAGGGDDAVDGEALVTVVDVQNDVVRGRLRRCERRNANRLRRPVERDVRFVLSPPGRENEKAFAKSWTAVQSLPSAPTAVASSVSPCHVRIDAVLDQACWSRRSPFLFNRAGPLRRWEAVTLKAAFRFFVPLVGQLLFVGAGGGLAADAEPISTTVKGNGSECHRAKRDFSSLPRSFPVPLRTVSAVTVSRPRRDRRVPAELWPDVSTDPHIL